MFNECACDDTCPEKCNKMRSCTMPECPCVVLWNIEIDATDEALKHYTPRQIHENLVEAYRRGIYPEGD